MKTPSQPDGPTPPPDAPAATFETSLRRLEDTVKRMEAGTLTLDEMLKAFEEGSRLVTDCNARLNEVERRIELLVKRDHKLEVRPFEVEGRVPAEDSHEQDR